MGRQEGRRRKENLTVVVAFFTAHLYIVSVPETSTLVTLVDEAVDVLVVGKNILGAAFLVVAEDEEHEVAVAVLTVSG